MAKQAAKRATPDGTQTTPGGQTLYTYRVYQGADGISQAQADLLAVVAEEKGLPKPFTLNWGRAVWFVCLPGERCARPAQDEADALRMMDEYHTAHGD